MSRFHSTTILAVRHNGKVAIGGDGQVTLGNVVMKNDAHKIRKLNNGRVLVGFAGASADAFALLERFEVKLKDFQGSVPRAATELAKDWRMDRNLRRLEAMMIALDKDNLLLLSGTGDVIQPTDGVAAIGSGGAVRTGGRPRPHDAFFAGRSSNRQNCSRDRRRPVHLHQSEH